MGADEERTAMRTHSPAYRDQTNYYQPVDGTPGGALASPSSSFFARAGRQPAPDIRLGSLSHENGDGVSANRPISIALVGEGKSHRALDLNEQIDVARFSSAFELVAAFRRGETSDVVLLDWNMGTAASDLLRELNRAQTRVPVAMVIHSEGDSGAADDSSEAGGHDQLLARVRLVAEMLRAPDGEASRRAAPSTPTALRLDTKTCQAFWKGGPVNLTITEFNIVSLFAKRVGENLSYREIYDIVHGPGFCAGDGVNGYQTNVRSLIKRIRQKFHEVDESFADIENHRGYGYRWRATEAAAGDDASTDEPGRVEQPAPPAPQTSAAPQTTMPAGAALMMVVYLSSSAAG